MVRMQPDLLKVLDAWADDQDDQITRPEAIRRLVEQALRKDPGEKSFRKAGSRYGRASKASELAGREIDRLVDRSAPVEERERRKRRLIKGPPEFRDVRGDLPKPKR